MGQTPILKKFGPMLAHKGGIFQPFWIFCVGSTEGAIGLMTGLIGSGVLKKNKEIHISHFQ